MSRGQDIAKLLIFPCASKLAVRSGLMPVQYAGRSSFRYRATTSSVIASAGPEQFGKGQNLGVARAIYTIAMCRYQLQNLLLAQAVARELIVGDRIDGDGGARQPIPQRLLPRSLRAE